MATANSKLPWTINGQAYTYQDLADWTGTDVSKLLGMKTTDAAKLAVDAEAGQYGSYQPSSTTAPITRISSAYSPTATPSTYNSIDGNLGSMLNVYQDLYNQGVPIENIAEEASKIETQLNTGGESLGSSDGSGFLGTLGDLASSAVTVGTGGAISPGFGEGWGEQLLTDASNAIVDTTGNILGVVGSALGLTEGDASSEAFNKIWPYKREQLQMASDAFNRPESMYPDFSQDTQNYIQGIKDRVSSGNLTLDQAQQALQGVFSGSDPSRNYFQNVMSGRIGQQDPSKSFFQQMQSGQFSDPTTQGYQQLFSSYNPAQGMLRGLGAAGSGTAFSQLGKTASGEYLGSNPYLDQTFNRASTKVTDAYKNAVDNINSNFSMAGRYGSGAHQKALSNAQQNLGETLSGLSTDIYGGNYQQERDRMLSAGGTLGGLENQAYGLGLQGVGLSSDIYGQNIDTKMKALGGIGNAFAGDIGRMQTGAGALSDIYGQGFNRMTQGAGALSDIYNKGQQTTLQAMDPAFKFGQQDYTDLGYLGQVGLMQDTLRTQQAQEPMTRASMYGSTIGGLPAQQPQGASPFGSLLGAGLGAWLAPAGSGIAGATLGAGLGGLFG